MAQIICHHMLMCSLSTHSWEYRPYHRNCNCALHRQDSASNSQNQHSWTPYPSPLTASSTNQEDQHRQSHHQNNHGSCNTSGSKLRLSCSHSSLSSMAVNSTYSSKISRTASLGSMAINTSSSSSISRSSSLGSIADLLDSDES